MPHADEGGTQIRQSMVQFRLIIHIQGAGGFVEDGVAGLVDENPG